MLPGRNHGARERPRVLLRGGISVLQEAIYNLLAAENDPELKDKAYEELENMGIDRRTADELTAEFRVDS